MEAAPRSWPQWLGDPQHADQLARLLPLELRALALADAPLAQHTLDRIAAHLAELSRSFRAMVPGWIGASPSAAYEYIADATLLFADVTGFTEFHVGIDDGVRTDAAARRDPRVRMHHGQVNYHKHLPH